MKRLLMSFLVAGLMITSALSLSSCKKTDTSANANNEEWIPTVVTFVTSEDLHTDLRDAPPYYLCPYENCDTLIPLCDHYILFPDYCTEHSHIHCFGPNDHCGTPTQQTNPYYYCRYMGVRKHIHVLNYTDIWFHNDAHVGGGVCP